MHCGGFSPETYDRYVLGLLEEPDRSQLEDQIQEQCPACLTGVQRSMNLWLVFAETLENAEPSEDFRGRMVRIAELSRKVLTFPKNSPLQDRPVILTSTLLGICVVMSILLLATWYAGRNSIRLDTQPGTADLDRLAQDYANSQVRLGQEMDRRKQIESELGSSGKTALTRSKQMEDALQKSQADVEQYKAVIARDRQQLADNTSLLNTLGHSSTRLLTLKRPENGEGFAYAFLAEKSQLVFVGSNLPKPSANHAYQLWVLRKEDPKAVSAGVFTPVEKGPTVVTYEEQSLLSEVIGLIVTEEETAGSSTPSTTKILASEEE